SMGQKSSHLSMLHPSIMDMRGYKVKVLELPPSPLTTALLRRTNKYLLRLHPEKMDLVGRHDSIRVCEISYFHIRALNQLGRVIIISLGRSSCFGEGKMTLRCSKTLSSSLISSSFIGRAHRLSTEVSFPSSSNSQSSSSYRPDRLSAPIMTPTQTQRQQVSPTLPLPPTPAPTSSVAQDRLTSISASSFETLTTTLASASLADVGNSTTRRRRSSSNRQNGNDETAEDLDGYLLMMPSSRRASTSGTSAGSSATPSGRHSAAAAAVGLPAVIADEYVLPVSAPDLQRQSTFDLYVGYSDGVSDTAETLTDATSQALYQNLPSPTNHVSSGRYAQIDWSQVMQDSLQYLDSSSSRAAVGATSAAAAAVRDEPLAEDSSDVLKYVSIDSARTQAIRDLIVDKVDSGRSRLMTDI
ncbi:hypothetical protein BOX15_Mlig007049g1, partial [Macrostomum lignano]